MEVLVVGGGGREHALAWKIARSPLVRRLSFTHDNPGFPPEADRVQGDVVDFAERAGVDLVVVGPEGPLAEGLADRLEERGIAVFGPTRTAARLEWSKAWARGFMARHRIPGPAWSVHESARTAHAAVRGPCVVKADGLAAGKGVVVAQDPAQAHAAIDEAMAGAWGSAGQTLLIEELLTGPELSVLALCDGERCLPLLPCRDWKRRFDHDRGPNTGGMGAICPVPGVDAGLLADIHARILTPAVRGMAQEGTPFRGVLYAGLMLTASGPRVLEFNARFGDPETQALLPMLDQDLVPLLLSAARGCLPELPLRWREGASCCVVMAAGDYPGVPRRGMRISGLPTSVEQVEVFYAGARRQGADLLADGGRVLNVVGWGPRLAAARARAYRAVRAIRFETAAWREDIGAAEAGIG